MLDARVVVLATVTIITDSANIDAVYNLLSYRHDLIKW